MDENGAPEPTILASAPASSILTHPPGSVANWPCNITRLHCLSAECARPGGQKLTISVSFYLFCENQLHFGDLRMCSTLYAQVAAFAFQ